MKLAISRRRRVEGQIFTCCSIDDPTSSSKVRKNGTKVVPGGTTAATPLLVPTRTWRRNNRRDRPVADHVSPSIARSRDLANQPPPSTCQQELCKQRRTIVAHRLVTHVSAKHDVVSCRPHCGKKVHSP